MKRLLTAALLLIPIIGFGLLHYQSAARADMVPGPAAAAAAPEMSAAQYSYSVKFVCGWQEEDVLAKGSVRPGIYATEINIHNYSYTPAGGINVLKNVIPLVIDGNPVGREPAWVKIGAIDGLTLPPEAATMDDCYRIGELLYGSPPPDPMPLTIGFLEVLTPIDVRVAAVYTTSNLDKQIVSMDVEEIAARMK